MNKEDDISSHFFRQGETTNFFTLKTLKNGAKVIFNIDTNICKSTTIAFQFPFGSVLENFFPGIKGLCHFVEHLVFLELKEKKEAKIFKLGGDIRAETSDEWTFYWTTSNLSNTSDLNFIIKTFLQILFNVSINKKRLNQEKNVVYTELLLKESDLSSYVEELFHQEIFQNTPFFHYKGKGLLTKDSDIAKNLLHFNVEMIYAFLDVFYQPCYLTCMISSSHPFVRQDQDCIYYDVIHGSLQYLYNEKRYQERKDINVKLYDMYYQQFRKLLLLKTRYEESISTSPSLFTIPTIPTILAPIQIKRNDNNNNTLACIGISFLFPWTYEKLFPFFGLIELMADMICESSHSYLIKELRTKRGLIYGCSYDFSTYKNASSLLFVMFFNINDNNNYVGNIIVQGALRCIDMVKNNCDCNYEKTEEMLKLYSTYRENKNNLNPDLNCSEEVVRNFNHIVKLGDPISKEKINKFILNKSYYSNLKWLSNLLNSNNRRNVKIAVNFFCFIAKFFLRSSFRKIMIY